MLWITTDTGKAMPLDAEGTPAVVALAFALPPKDERIAGYTSEGSRVVGRVPLDGEAPTTTIHASHFATCPHAAQHRRGRT